MTDAPLFDSTDFRIPPGIVHVCAGGRNPFLHRRDGAMRRHATDKSDGIAGRDRMDAEVAHLSGVRVAKVLRAR